MNKWTCFTATPTRVTSSVSNISSVDKIPVTINVSVDWAPNPQAGSSNLFLYGNGTSGEPNPTLQADLAQIADIENKALWENGLYSELRSMIAELGGLVPASQVNTPAFQAVVHDAILNGYVPKDVYDKFKDAIIVQGEGQNNLVVVVDSARRPSLQARVDERIAKYIENTGKEASDVSVIVISDADSRDNKIDDTAYAQALKDLGSVPLQQRAAQEQVKLKEEQRKVELAQAETQNQVALANTNAANDRARLDAEAKKVRTLIEAAAQAEAKEKTGAADNAVKEQLAKILADNPGLVQVLTAEELSQVNILVLGDGSGLNLNVPTTGG